MAGSFSTSGPRGNRGTNQQKKVFLVQYTRRLIDSVMLEARHQSFRLPAKTTIAIRLMHTWVTYRTHRERQTLFPIHSSMKSRLLGPEIGIPHKDEYVELPNTEPSMTRKGTAVSSFAITSCSRALVSRGLLAYGGSPCWSHQGLSKTVIAAKSRSTFRRP